MVFIAMVTDEETTGSAAELFEQEQERYGYVPNQTRLFAHRPRVLSAWRQLVAAVSKNMDERRYELRDVGRRPHAPLGLPDARPCQRLPQWRV